ncbi:hypothetical protein Tco_0935345 [Tanacetum coccineum]
MIIDDDVEEESTKDALTMKKGKDKEKLQELTASDLHLHHPNQQLHHQNQSQIVHWKQSVMPRKDFKAITEGVHATLKEVVLNMIKFERPTPLVEPCRVYVVRTRDHEDHHDDDARPKGEISAKRKRTSEFGTYVTPRQGRNARRNMIGIITTH